MIELQIKEALVGSRHLDCEGVILCGKWYLRFKLAIRDLLEMMAGNMLHQ